MNSIFAPPPARFQFHQSNGLRASFDDYGSPNARTATRGTSPVLGPGRRVPLCRPSGTVNQFGQTRTCEMEAAALPWRCLRQIDTEPAPWSSSPSARWWRLANDRLPIFCAAQLDAHFTTAIWFYWHLYEYPPDSYANSSIRKFDDLMQQHVVDHIKRGKFIHEF